MTIVGEETSDTVCLPYLHCRLASWQDASSGGSHTTAIRRPRHGTYIVSIGIMTAVGEQTLSTVCLPHLHCLARCRGYTAAIRRPRHGIHIGRITRASD